MKYFGIYLLIVVLLISCNTDTLPKQKSYLILRYPESEYVTSSSFCPYSFEISKYAKIDFQNNCWAKIQYPTLKATIHLTYRNVDGNLNEILKEVEKLTFEHTIKADAISSIPYDDLQKKIFAKLYNVDGNVATNIQFSATDSLNYVLSGALYFYVKPNYDSIVPAIKYIEKDMMHMVETLEWK
ncbi:gliding motility lipoprotein GldD [Lutibacter sp. HS1-25]|uniref:gliding motility lipoprotein GldD n=1 Tax=Lutibacter sp. HS1-25 TaxID=2485000 RepID=UPI0010126872|nr:gliding motility lipoprotein GldD [Lutibacter sp. HS1-25]RXP45889.1 gliding motility lipoprotein GldD [Lutibacter sp. HS1-25]